VNVKPQDFKDVYERITEQIIQELENGTPPWIRPWSYTPDVSEDQIQLWPRNAYSGNFYGGSNVLMCWTHMARLGLVIGKDEPLFLTFKQAKMLGGHVKKGEKGIIVIGFRQGTKEVEDEESGDTKQVSRTYAFGHYVFHISQTEGVNLKRQNWKKRPSLLPELSNDANWKSFVKALGVDLRHGGNRAFYHVLGDYVQMPPVNSFRNLPLYKSVACHEFIHWTGHDSRLKRGLHKNIKGDAQYAEEELIAELGAAFLCARLGIEHRELRHASYIKSWLGVLKNDKRFIFKASREAMKAVEYIEELALKGMQVKKPVSKASGKQAPKARKAAKGMGEASPIH